MVGNVEKWINKEYLTNVFYDIPISGSVKVFENGALIDEFSLYDLKGFDEYAYYDKDKLILMIAEYLHELLIDCGYLPKDLPSWIELS